MKCKAIVFVIAFTLIFSEARADDDVTKVRNSVSKMVDAVIAVLKKKELDKKSRNDRIIEAVSPSIDFQKMAELSLGQKHWAGIGGEKQQEYSKLMIFRLQESYLEKLDLYTDEEVVMGDAERVKNRIHVVTVLVSKDERIDMIYKFYDTGNGWKVYDIEIMNVSIVQTYRTQFNDVMRSGSIDDLLSKLKKPGEFTVPTPRDGSGVSK